MNHLLSISENRARYWRDKAPCNFIPFPSSTTPKAEFRPQTQIYTTEEVPWQVARICHVSEARTWFGKPPPNIHYLAMTWNKFRTKILAMELWKQDEILTFSLEGCLGYPLNSHIIPRVPERPQNSEQMRRSFKNRVLKNLINKLKALKRIVKALRARP